MRLLSGKIIGVCELFLLFGNVYVCVCPGQTREVEGAEQIVR